MKTVSKYSLTIGWVWLLSVLALDVVIPLHFFVREHSATSCHTNDKNCCQDKESDCAICQFDLFVGFPHEYRPEIAIFELLSAILNSSISDIATKCIIHFYSLRAPPSVNVL